MKIRFLKLKNWLLLTAMGLFGVTACQSSKSAVKPEEVNGKNASEASEEIGNAVVMYGTPTVKYDTQERSETALMYGVPTMDFVLKGKVKDEKGNLAMSYTFSWEGDSIITDSVDYDLVYDENEIRIYKRKNN